MALKRTNKRPQLHRRDRLFWIVQTAGYRHIALKQPRAIPLRKGASSVVPLAEAAFQTLLGLGTARPPTSYGRIRGGRDMLKLLEEA